MYLLSRLATQNRTDQQYAWKQLRKLGPLLAPVGQGVAVKFSPNQNNWHK